MYSSDHQAWMRIRAKSMWALICFHIDFERGHINMTILDSFRGLSVIKLRSIANNDKFGMASL